ncbi:signal recognition particle-docking protein FtsY [uncultured Celeribacter sp.]|uniref:signal recognition particle-docking protein FtsY n=1 Tax=uncultured Celeribacter sp. TaxID=1303376 RepID=UPI002AA6E7BC|nr:signal recognition particle-docking protein FtsY [uncultured Celeribacter sp.]
MSLFSKLKSRLMKTSSKLDEGLEAIVEDGGEESSVEEAYVEEVAAEPETPESPVAPDVTPEPLPEPTPEPQPIPEPLPEELPTDVPQELPQDLPKDVPDTPSPDVTPPSDVAPLEMPVQVPAEVPVEMPVEIPVETVIEAPVQTPTQTRAETVKPGFLGRLLGRKETKTVIRRALDDDMLEQLEELLITADMGVETSMRVTAAMAEGRYGKKLSVEEIKRLMAQEVARIMEPVAKPMPLYTKTPQVVLVVGVNGSGKTTTIGKLASQFRAAGKSVVIAAGDTFRAAAVEQLQVWGERAGVPVLTAPEGSDPASLAFDAMTKAQETGADLLMIDTAGRLQNRADLMEELAKIVRVIRKKDETAPHNTLLVLDATTGQNAVSQVEIFQKIADVSGLVMTKLDGTAKGGVLVSLADKFGLPIHAIGVGEQIDDLAPFDPEEFAAALTGLEV